MASRTALQIIILTNQQTGLEVIDGTFNGSGNTTTTGQVTALQNRPDASFIGRHLYIDGGSPTIREHVLKNSTQSSGELTWYAALGAAPDSLDFLVLPFSRTDTLNAIVDTVLTLHDEGALVRPVMSWGMVGGSPLYNAGWDYWTGTNTVDGWAKNGTGTVERERASANIWSGPQSLKLSTVADYVALGEPWKRYLEDFKGETVRMFCPVKASNASHARINLYTGSDNYSSYHTGGGGWEILDTGNIAVSNTATDLEPRLYNDSTNAVYFGRPWFVSGVSIRDYPFPAALFTRINTVRRTTGTIHPDGDNRSVARHFGSMPLIHDYEELFYRDEATSTEVATLHFAKPPVSESVIVLDGSGPLAIPASDTAQVEIDQTESYLIASLAAARLLEDRAPKVGEPLATSYRRKAGDLRQRAEQLKRGYSRARQEPPIMQAVM